MNNCEEFNCPGLEIQISELKEALRCFIYTILFNRAIGGNRAVDPFTVRSPLFDLAYAKVEAPEIDLQVEERIKAFGEAAEKAPGQPMMLLLSFYTETAKESGIFWQVFSAKKTEKVYFERWKLPINITQSRPVSAGDDDSVRSSAVSASQVKSLLWFVLRKVGEKMDHLPPSSLTPIYLCDITYDKQKSDSAWSPRSLASSIKSLPYIT